MRVLKNENGRSSRPTLGSAIGRVLPILAMSCLVGTNVAADPLSSPSQDEVISTAWRTESSDLNTSLAVSVLRAQAIQNIGAHHIAELGVRHAGVNIARNNGQEYLTSIRSPIFTGAGACGAFLTAQDGIAMRASGFCNVNELFESFSEQAERIEITKGSGSALYGSNALHGIINIISPAADGNGGFISLEYGADDYTRLMAAHGAVSDTKSGASSGYLLRGSFSHDGGARDSSGYDQQKISVRHDYHGAVWDISSQILATNLNQETAGYITGLDAYKDAVVSRTNPNPEAYRDAKSLRVSSRFSAPINDKTVLKITPYARSVDMEFLMHFLPGQPTEENGHDSLGFQSGLYVTPTQNFTYVMGIDAEFSNGFLRQTQANPTQGSKFLRVTIPVGKQYDYSVETRMFAGFIQGNWDISDRFHVQGGARLEHITYDYTNHMLVGRTDENGSACGFGGCRYNRPKSRSDDFTALSPKLGMVYNVLAGIDLYGNLSQGFRAPQTSELYRLQRAQSVADLDKVELKNIDFGIRGQWGRLGYDLSVYGSKKDNIIFRDADYFNVDNAKSDHKGADIVLVGDLGNGVNLRVNAGFAKHRYGSDHIISGMNINGLDIDTAPRRFGGAQLNWAVSEQFTAELEWVHMGPYFLEPTNSFRYDGHDLFNLRAHLGRTSGVRISARLMNVFNRDYASRADYTGFTDERYFPGNKRSLFVEIRKTY